MVGLRGGSSPAPCLYVPQGKSKCPCMSRGVLGHDSFRGFPASAWLSRQVEHKAEPGVVVVREAEGDSLPGALGDDEVP